MLNTREEQVHRREPVDHRAWRALDRGEIAGVRRAAPADEHQHERDRDVDQRAGDRDQEFLARLFRNALEPRHAADRQQRHVRRRHAEGARGEDVAELVREHAGEQQQHEGERLPGRLRRRPTTQLATKIQPRNSRKVKWTRIAVPAIDADIERPGHEDLRTKARSTIR